MKFLLTVPILLLIAACGTSNQNEKSTHKGKDFSPPNEPLGLTGRAKNKERRLAIKKWTNGQWLAGLVPHDSIEKLLALGETNQLFPHKEKSLKVQIAERDLIPLKGIAIGTEVNNDTVKDQSVQIGSLMIYRIHRYKKGDKLNRILSTKNYLDKESVKIVAEGNLKKIRLDCISYWVIDIKEDDLYFEGEIGHAFPRTMKVYFVNTSVSRMLRKKAKTINSQLKKELIEKNKSSSK